MTMESIFALCVVGVVVGTAPAPGPAASLTTAGPGPAPAPAAVTTSAAAVTTTAAAYFTHTITFSVGLTNVSAITTTAALIASLKAGIEATTGGNVTVVIQHIKISSTYSGLPSGFAPNSVITAYVTLTGLPQSAVTCNGAAHTGGRRLDVDNVAVAVVEATPVEATPLEADAETEARRLTTTAVMEGTIANTNGSNVVATMHQVLGNLSNASHFQAALNSAGVQVSNLGLTSPATPTVSVTTTITGSSVNESTVNANLAANVAAQVPGANVTGVDVTTSSEASTTEAPNGGDSGAIPIAAPMMTILAAVMALCAAVSFA
jgi:hypothetical protein